MSNKSLSNSAKFSQFCAFRKSIISLFLFALPVTCLFAGETPTENETRSMKSVSGDLPRNLHETASGVVLTAEDFNKGNNASIWQLIQGRAPGLWITLDGGAPGAMGSSSLFAATGQPLIVVDGLPQDPRFAAGMRDPLNFLNPEDIESITLLTDAASTSLYGGRGGNGVILIRTKRAQQGTPFSLEYSSHLSAAQPGKQVDVLDAATFRFLVSERFSDKPEVTGLMGQASTSWQDEIFSNTFSQSHNLSASGNVAQIPWRAAFHFNDHAGALNTDNLKRLGGRLNLSPSLLDNHLRININLHTSQLENRIAPRDAISHAISFDPTQPVRDPESIHGGYFAWSTTSSPESFSHPNPVAMLNLTEDFNATQTFGIQANADYALHFFPDITLGIAAYQQTLSSDREKIVSHQASWLYYEGGRYEANEDTYSNRLLEGRIHFNRLLSAINSRIDLTAAISRQDFNHEYSLFLSNIDNNIAGVPYRILINRNGLNERQLVAFSFAAGYAFKNLYFLDYNYRNDRSSVYNPDNQSFGYHSLAAAWKLHNESFWSEDFLLSQLIIRSAMGQSGNINIPPWYMLTIDLEPERFNTYDAAIDYGLWDNRLTGSVRYFATEQSGMVYPVAIPSMTNYDYMLTNIGKTEHKGWDFSLFATPIKSGQLSWDIGAHFTTKASKVTELIDGHLDFPDFSPGTIIGYNQNIYILRKGYSPGSFYVLQSLYSPDGYPLPNMYVDHNDDGYFDRIPFKSSYPDILMGISSHLQYSNWRLSMAGTWVSGNYVYNHTASFLGNYHILYRNAGPNLGNITTEALQLNFEHAHYLSDYFVQDASYFRMDYIDLAYNFNNLTARNLNLEISATVQNAFVITSYPGPEPEVPTGIDFSHYPRPRMFTLGVKMGF